MAFTLLTHTAAQGTTATVTTAAIDTRGANLIIVVLDEIGITTLTDSASNTWSTAASIAVNTTLRIFYVLNPTTSATHTFTQPSVASSFPGIAVACFSGAAAAAVADQVSTGTESTGTTHACGSLTPTVDGELIIYALGNNFLTAAIDIGTIANVLPLISNVSEGVGLAYEIQATAAARNATWTISNSQTITIAASFKSDGIPTLAVSGLASGRIAGSGLAVPLVAGEGLARQIR